MRILIAEDESMSCRLLEKTLLKWGYDVVVAHDGLEAWEVLGQEASPQLAIIDWMMPGIDGVELCRRTRETPEKLTYIILLTAKGEKCDIAAGLTAGANDYITKPFDREELHARVQVGARMVEMQTRVMAGIEERKQAEEERRRLEDQLRQSQKMESIGTLAGGIAHDFNNLLTVINGYSELLLKVPTQGESLNQKLKGINAAGMKAATLTRQLLAFSRRQQLERKIISLNDTITDLLKMLQRIIGEDVEVRFQTTSNLAPVFADPGQIEQVLLNLAVNARDAMSEGGELIIETDNVALDEAYCHDHPYVQRGDYVRIMVSDTGAGMDAATRLRIFEPFFTTKEVGKGTGLGLSMVYGIVKQHEGSIEVSSELGRGTTFEIYLPAERRTIEEDLVEVTSVLRGGTETILVAEDQDAVRELAQATLEDLGYLVIPVRNGEEAVKMYEANRAQIDLVMLDMVMPRMSGPEAYEAIRAIDADIPIFFVTGYCSETVENRFVLRSRFIEETGASVIQKPYSVDVLGRKVRQMLDQAKQSGSAPSSCDKNPGALRPSRVS
jgi:signal transduction histidine kinase